MIFALTFQLRPFVFSIEALETEELEVDEDEYTSADVSDIIEQVNEFNGLYANRSTRKLGF